MSDIEIHSKSDRELLIMVVSKLNTLCEIQRQHDRWILGNGIPGAKTQLYILWGCFIGLGVTLVKEIFK